MWLNEKMLKSEYAPEIENASVTIGGSSVETLASAQQRETAVYAPYGYACCIPAGAQVLLITNGSTGAVAGARVKSGTLEPGEVEIKSAGGAKIRLCNDGSVMINSMIINSKGEIET